MATTAHHGLRTPARRPESFHTAARAEHRDETGGGLSPAALVLIAAAAAGAILGILLALAAAWLF